MDIPLSGVQSQIAKQIDKKLPKASQNSTSQCYTYYVKYSESPVIWGHSPIRSAESGCGDRECGVHCQLLSGSMDNQEGLAQLREGTIKKIKIIDNQSENQRGGHMIVSVDS